MKGGEKIMQENTSEPMELAEEILRLSRDLKDCRNELCLRCGDYKLAHKGACDGCRWKDMGD